MSQERKLLKIFCFLLVACGVACVVVGATSFAGAGAVAPELQVWSYGLGAWGVAEGVLAVLLAAAGIRGANTPRRAGEARVPGVVMALLALAGGAASVLDPAGVQAAATVTAALALVLAACCAVMADKVLEQAQR